ncbi:glycosyltransferase [Waterburya agarophytonicola K14]|uniref:Glycosyltransferase n=1 Tax=Waterburya agarophytonicola KI4 TaxID=2874699 RepID=A0A964BU15_9CYAN|nr:glycosyltransferase [Waterburya agarophytonicola]MCC0178508.1 glycosyltransferase [Waterburya agarophytonicola KI4]
MKIAYLVHFYPKVSHSFVRREIAALEEMGISVDRFSIRSCASELVDAADISELAKTKIVLDTSKLVLLLSLLQVLISRPIRFLKAFKLTCQIGWGSDRGLLRNLMYLAEACLLLKWFKEEDISHLHAHFGINPAAVAMLCNTLGGPSYSFTVHGPKEFDSATGLALSEKINRAKFVVAISSFGKSQLYRWCDRSNWSKIHVVHCGLDKMFLNAPYQPIPDQQQLVCVGRLCEQKGQLLLVEAAGKLAQEGLDFKLVLVGNGPLRKEIEALAIQLNIKDKVEITGWASNSEVQRHILASKAMVLPSFAEGLPVVIMEALALGRPVLSTYVAGIPELVQPDCGWLVYAGSVDDLTVKMRTVLQLPIDELEKMGKVGIQRVAQYHDVKQEALKLGNLLNYEDLIVDPLVLTPVSSNLHQDDVRVTVTK